MSWASRVDVWKRAEEFTFPVHAGHPARGSSYATVPPEESRANPRVIWGHRHGQGLAATSFRPVICATSLDESGGMDSWTFLKKLNERTGDVRRGDGRYGPYWHSKDGAHLTEKELTRVCEIVKDELHFTFTPCNTDFGFRIGFDVEAVVDTAPGVPVEITHLLRFTDRQLPPGWGWDQLKLHFTSAERLRLYGMPGIGSKSQYEY